MPREEDQRSGKFVGLDGCSASARGEAVPAPGFTTKQGSRVCIPVFQRTHGHGTTTVREPSSAAPEIAKIVMFVCKDECPMPLVMPKSMPVGTVSSKVMAGRCVGIVAGLLPVSKWVPLQSDQVRQVCWRPLCVAPGAGLQHAFHPMGAMECACGPIFRIVQSHARMQVCCVPRCGWAAPSSESRG